MNSTEKKRIVEKNLRLFMIQDALVDNYITEEKIHPSKKETNLERREPQPKTYSFIEAIIKCRGLDLKPILD